MEQTLKIVIVVLFVIICVSSYFYYSNENYEKVNVYNYNSTLLQFTYNSSQLDILFSDSVRTKAVNSKSEISEMKHRNFPENKKVIQAQHPPDLIDDINPSIMPQTGYILPYSIYEEQTNGANNLWQLQIWAKQVEMHVVEPFAVDSVFTMRSVIPKFGQALRFGDYYDKDEWDRIIIKAGGNPLVKWEDFITSYPHDAIILYTTKRENVNPPLIVAYDENTTVCGKRPIAKEDISWINKHFNVLKTVCYLCATNIDHSLSVDQFNSLIFHDNRLKPNQVTLITVNWLGIRKARIHIDPLALFSSPLDKKFTFSPSKRVMTAYKAYVQQYIGDHKYVGIVFRTHHVLYFSPLKGSFANQTKYLLQCSRTLREVLNPIRTQWKIFLAYDMGTFGSKKYVQRNQLVSLQEQIFLDVFNGSLQVNEREENLRNAANGTRDRGLIAQLEKVIATEADCIVLLGPRSTFVRSSSYMYISNHLGMKKCIVSICAEKVYSPDHHKVISSDSIPNSFFTN